MTNIEFILELGKCCIDIAVFRSMGAHFRESQCKQEARRLVFQEGLTRWYERKYNLPNFLCDDSLYPEYRETFEDGFRASESIKDQFEQRNL